MAAIETSKLCHLLECPICMSPYDTRRIPKALPCQHTYCKPCIRRLVRSMEEHMDGFPCPECRSHITFPEGGINVFPTNSTIAHLVEMVSMAQECEVKLQEEAHDQVERTPHTIEDISGTIDESTQKNNDCAAIITKREVIGGEGVDDGKFLHPWGVTWDRKNKRLLVSDYYNSRIQVFASNLTHLFSFGEEGSEEGELKYPAGVAVANDGTIFVADQFNHRVQMFDEHGEFLDSFGTKGTEPGMLKYPCGIAIGNAGDIFVCDRDNKRIQKFGTSGIVDESFVVDLTKEPCHIAASSGNIHVTFVDSNEIQIFTEDGHFTKTLQLEGPEKHTLNGLDIGSTGNIITVTESGSIVQFLSDGSAQYYLNDESSTCEELTLRSAHSVVTCMNGSLAVTTWDDHSLHLLSVS